MRRPRKDRSVYVIRAETGLVKIGISARPQLRFYTLRTQSAVPLFLEYAAKCADASAAEGIEATAHKLLHAHRVNGEWFSVDVEAAANALREAAAIHQCDLYSLPLIQSEQPSATYKRAARRQSRFPLDVAVGDFLRERRQQARLSQRDLAERLGWDHKTVSKIENGTKRLTLVELGEIAGAVGFDPMTAVRRLEAHINAASGAARPRQDQNQEPPQAPEAPQQLPVSPRSQSSRSSAATTERACSIRPD